MQDIFSGVINTIKTKKNVLNLKLLVRIQSYTAVDFQGWSKMNPKAKMAHIPMFRSGFRKIP